MYQLWTLFLKYAVIDIRKSSIWKTIIIWFSPQAKVNLLIRRTHSTKKHFYLVDLNIVKYEIDQMEKEFQVSEYQCKLFHICIEYILLSANSIMDWEIRRENESSSKTETCKCEKICFSLLQDVSHWLSREVARDCSFMSTNNWSVF